MSKESLKNRDRFSDRLGFVMAAIGSAVGMANVWAFPYRVAKFGGAAFLIPYLLCVVVLARTGVVCETCFGRWAETGPMGAVEKALDGKGPVKHAGVIPIFSSFAIATGYAVITGWVIRFLAGPSAARWSAPRTWGPTSARSRAPSAAFPGTCWRWFSPF